MTTQKREAHSVQHMLPALIHLTHRPNHWARISGPTWGGTIVRLRWKYTPLGYEFTARGSRKNGRCEAIYGRFRPERAEHHPDGFEWGDPPPILRGKARTPQPSPPTQEGSTNP